MPSILVMHTSFNNVCVHPDAVLDACLCLNKLKARPADKELMLCCRC